MFTIYHNTRCRKSRAGLKYLQDHNQDFRVVEYLKQPLSDVQIRELLAKLGKEPQDILRTQEELYKKELKGKNFSDDEWISIIVANPKLMQRPIVVRDYKAVIGDPPENIEALL